MYLRAELIDAKAQNSVLDQELHTLLLQLHASQLQHLPGVHTESDAERIRRRLEEELQQSPTHQHRSQSASLQDIIALHGHSLYSDVPSISDLPKTSPKATLLYPVICVGRKGRM